MSKGYKQRRTLLKRHDRGHERGRKQFTRDPNKAADFTFGVPKKGKK